MGNKQSSQTLSTNFDKDTRFLSLEADDGGFLEAKLKSVESGALNRGHTGRKSFHYIRLKENQQDLTTKDGKGAGGIEKDQLIRVHSLPASRVKKKSNTLGAKRETPNGKTAATKIPVQGFDMFRHHLGQMNVDVVLFQQLETEILSLNEKLTDLETTRLSCLAKLTELGDEVRQNQVDQLLAGVDVKVSSKKGKANELALKIISNYVQRIDNLLRVDDEPFLVDVKKTTAKSSTQAAGESLSSQFLEQSIKLEQNSCSSRSKRQQIKDSYNQLIRRVMPQLFGKQFAHRDESAYRGFKRNLSELRDTVGGIPTADEQKLLDAKRIFLQEIDGYLHTLDQMITCPGKECSRCNV